KTCQTPVSSRDIETRLSPPTSRKGLSAYKAQVDGSTIESVRADREDNDD
ncbi:MAG: hypothetical protein ACI8S6_000684, partial [Myxococcota bacterium]